MATPYLGLNDSAVSGEKFNLKRLNDNTQKIEKALYSKRADLDDRVQIGYDWFTQPAGSKDWLIYKEDASGNKVVRHGVWAMVEIQLISNKAITIPANGNVTNRHIISLATGYRPASRIALTSINSPVDMTLELNPNGNGYYTAFNHTSRTIPKDTIIRIGGRYVYVP